MTTPLLKEIQLFLTTYCQQERRLSRQTILSYRDTMKMFILYQHNEKRKKPQSLGIDVLSYETIIEFLNFLQEKRSAAISTRNQRLCAIKSLCRYIIFRHPDHADAIARCLVVPQKKKGKKNRTFLESSEVSALIKQSIKRHGSVGEII